METPKKFYRAEGSCCHDHASISMRTYDLVRETKKGYWIIDTFLSSYDIEKYKKFIRKEGKKKLAYETEKEAIVSLLHRTNRRIEILSSQLSRAKKVLESAIVLAKKNNIIYENNRKRDLAPSFLG